MADLSNVKEGDTLAIPQRPFGWAGPKILWNLTKVTRVTPTQIVCGPFRYHKLTDRKIGDNGFGRAEPATKEIIAEYNSQVRAKNVWAKARNVAEKLYEDVRRDNLPKEQQEKLIELFGHLLEEPK